MPVASKFTTTVVAPLDELTGPQPKLTAPPRVAESTSPPVLVARTDEMPLTLAPAAPKLLLQSRLPDGSSLAIARSLVPALVSGAPPKLTVPVKVVASRTFSDGSSEMESEGGRALLHRQAPVVGSRWVSTVLVTPAVPTVPQRPRPPSR